MKERIISIYDIGPLDIFHFSHSLMPFILRGADFVSLQDDWVVAYRDLKKWDLNFYEDEEEGEKVAVFGELSW